MKLTTTTMVTVDGVMQGLGAPDEDRGGGFERGGWVTRQFDNEAMTFINQVYQRADAFLFGRRTLVGQGTRLFPDIGPDTALELVDSRATPKGVTIQVYRPTGRPQYATATAD